MHGGGTEADTIPDLMTEPILASRHLAECVKGNAAWVQFYVALQWYIHVAVKDRVSSHEPVLPSQVQYLLF